MIIKKIGLGLVLSLLWSTISFANVEDWKGSFTIINLNNETQKVTHTPTYVQYLFFTAGECIYLDKGTVLNGMKLQDNVNLCTNLNVEKFEGEVKKLGSILNKEVTLGPTY